MNISKVIQLSCLLLAVAATTNTRADDVNARVTNAIIEELQNPNRGPDGAPEANPYDPEDRVVVGPNGEAPETQSPYDGLVDKLSTCTEMSCHVYVHVAQTQRPQMLYLYIDGKLSDQWLVSTGVPSLPTPDFDRHPDGNFAKGPGSSIPQGFCTSNQYLGGDYYETRIVNGKSTSVDLGNMPYCVGIEGGFYIHGEAAPVTGTPASHGCVRSPPAKAKTFLALVQSVGINAVWIHID